MDGVGEWATTSAGVGNGHELKIQKEINFPHSLGLLYAAFTYYTGFKVNSGEYKVMGLAPYGIPKYAQLIYDHLIDLKPDGSFRLNLDYFNYCTGLTMTNERFDALFDGAPRMPAAPLEQRHMDLAASIQVVIEEAVLRLSRSLAEETGEANLLPCRRRGTQLRCQRQGAARRQIREHLGTAGGGRLGRRAGRGADYLSSLCRSTAHRRKHAGRHGGLLSQP